MSVYEQKRVDVPFRIYLTQWQFQWISNILSDRTIQTTLSIVEDSLQWFIYENKYTNFARVFDALGKRMIMDEKLLKIFFFQWVFYSETKSTRHILARANVLLVHWKNSSYFIYIYISIFSPYISINYYDDTVWIHFVWNLLSNTFIPFDQNNESFCFHVENTGDNLIKYIASSVNCWHWSIELTLLSVVRHASSLHWRNDMDSVQRCCAEAAPWF